MIEPASAKDIPEVQAIFTAAWNFAKQFYNLKQDSSQEDWNQCMLAYSDLSRMSMNRKEYNEFAKSLGVAVFHLIEYRSKTKE